MDENALSFRHDQALLSLIREQFCGGVTAELARRINKDPSYVARLFYPGTKKGAKGIGLEVMKACEAAFPLPPGYWSMDFGNALLELSGHADSYRNTGGLPGPGTPSPAKTLTTELVVLARPLRPTLRKNLASLIAELLDNIDDPIAIEQTIRDIERFYPRVP